MTYIILSLLFLPLVLLLLLLLILLLLYGYISRLLQFLWHRCSSLNNYLTNLWMVVRIPSESSLSHMSQRLFMPRLNKTPIHSLPYKIRYNTSICTTSLKHRLTLQICSNVKWTQMASKLIILLGIRYLLGIWFGLLYI